MKGLTRDQYTQLAKTHIDVIHSGVYKIRDTTVRIPDYIPGRFVPPGSTGLAIKQNAPKDLKIEVVNESAVDSIYRLHSEGYSDIGVLNFASARNRGGGFIKGSMAQEESLCHASTLYCQLAANKFYVYNEEYSKDGEYTDAMVVTDTWFIKDSEFNYVEPVNATVITSAAVNRRTTSAFKELNGISDKRMHDRMRYILEEFIRCGCKTIVLGAFGCGVFRNNPKFVANTWKDLIEQYGGYFTKVVFAVLDNGYKDKFDIFMDVFCDWIE